MEGELKKRAGLSGLIAVAVALGLGELLAGLFGSVPSPLASVGGLVVDSSPSFVKDFAIAVFGTADKTALAIGTTVIALALGWQLGVLARTRVWLGAVVFGLFGALGVFAARNEAFSEVVPVVAATVVASVAGWLVLMALLGSVETEQPTDGLSGDSSRRKFLLLAAGTSAAAVVAGASGRALLTRVRELPEIDLGPTPTTVPDALTTFEFDVPGISPIVVPNDQFYRIDTALIVPTVDEQDWSLRVHGLVDQEITLGYDELLAMDRVEDYVTIACVSNEVGGSLVGNALWSGVRLVEVLEMAGVDSAAEQIVGRSVDGFTAGFPQQLAFDGREPLIASA